MRCKEELHRSKAWAYKWLSRFQREGLEGLRYKPTIGRPPDVSEEKLSEIGRELAQNPSGWKAKVIILSARKQESNTMKFMSIGYYTSGTYFSAKYQERGGLSMLHPVRKKSNSKNSTRNYRES